MKSKNTVPFGRKILVNRGLVEQHMEQLLLAIGKISDKEEINWSLLPEDVVFYANVKAEKEGMVTITHAKVA